MPHMTLPHSPLRLISNQLHNSIIISFSLSFFLSVTIWSRQGILYSNIFNPSKPDSCRVRWQVRDGVCHMVGLISLCLSLCGENEINQESVLNIFDLCIYLIGILRLTNEYLTYTTAGELCFYFITFFSKLWNFGVSIRGLWSALCQFFTSIFITCVLKIGLHYLKFAKKFAET